MKECRHIEDDVIVDYLYQEVAAAEVDRVKRHLEQCEKCSETLAAYARIQGAFHALPEEEPSPAISARLLHEAARQRKPRIAQRALSFVEQLVVLIVRHQAVAATATVIVVVAVATGYHAWDKVRMPGELPARTAAPATGSKEASGEPKTALGERDNSKDLPKTTGAGEEQEDRSLNETLNETLLTKTDTSAADNKVAAFALDKGQPGSDKDRAEAGPADVVGYLDVNDSQPTRKGKLESEEISAKLREIGAVGRAQHAGKQAIVETAWEGKGASRERSVAMGDISLAGDQSKTPRTEDKLAAAGFAARQSFDEKSPGPSTVGVSVRPSVPSSVPSSVASTVTSRAEEAGERDFRNEPLQEEAEGEASSQRARSPREIGNGVALRGDGTSRNNEGDPLAGFDQASSRSMPASVAVGGSQSVAQRRQQQEQGQEQQQRRLQNQSIPKQQAQRQEQQMQQAQPT
ncbi:MAG: hypothetical protein V2A73_05295, partial [Pseudomonadota bacterium]